MTDNYCLALVIAHHHMTGIFCIYTKLVVVLLRYLLSCKDTNKAKPYNMTLLFGLVLSNYIKKNRLPADSSPKRLLSTNFSGIIA